ncbi:thioredoxin family protein [Pseudomonas muyukensis]|uniref:Thioredoxin family protein n=1 Tax=Pseudomonas muyukensis TaxID=2842357 RepID=A0ABX8M8X6_9PSED|nr:thioredoxin family protein [Pseudomonas muyukensis]QXH35433.1 thioredoxin family protein [Pseudomonas muyukensis]
MPIRDVSEAEFNRAMHLLGMPALLYVWAPWCAPCRLFSPIYQQTVTPFPGVAAFRINAASAPQIQTALNLATVPAVLAFNRDGKETGRFIGLKNGQQLHEWVLAHLTTPAPPSPR